MKRKTRFFMADFETTVYEGQEKTEVWAAAIVELFTEDVQFFTSIEDFYNYVKSLNCHAIVYFHNLKFDGEFILSYLLLSRHYRQAYTEDAEGNIHWKKENEMYTRELKYMISEMGQWYNIVVKEQKHFIEFRDSLKLLPYSVKRIGESFGTAHKKLEMEYKGYRHAGMEIPEHEKSYIRNDVLVVKEALEIMFNEGHDKMTIGSCCMAEFKKTFLGGKEEYDRIFPALEEIQLPESMGDLTAERYIRRSYRGGWCYVNKYKAGKELGKGWTFDVNSLYPSVMHSMSDCKYPYGVPKIFEGEIPEEGFDSNHYFFVRFSCRFKIKEGYLPFIQIKRNLLYDGTEMLETSDIYDAATGEYYRFYEDLGGNRKEARVTLTLTKPDWILFFEHYHVYDLQIMDGLIFRCAAGLFDEYIEKYKTMKMTSKGARREMAKLFQNNLYGKTAASEDSSFKVVYEKSPGVLGFKLQYEADKKPGYIAVGSAITSYARCFTIRMCQKNYHGAGPGFAYADTDSYHGDGIPPEEIKGATIDNAEYCCWKPEATWDRARFERQKTYIEHVIEDTLEPCRPFWNIKCAGMPEKSKKIFEYCMEPDDKDFYEKCTKEEQKYMDKHKYSMNNFREGLEVPGKLRPVRIPGGLILQDTTYKIKG